MVKIAVPLCVGEKAISDPSYDSLKAISVSEWPALFLSIHVSWSVLLAPRQEILDPYSLRDFSCLVL